VELLERDEQLAVLAAANEEAAAGRGCVVLLEGEPGIGKTALITRAAADVAGSTRVLWGSCDDLSIPRALAPLTGLVGEVSGPVREALASGRPRADVHALLLAELAAEPGPTMLVLEDVHWADEATLDLITVLGRRVGELPAMLVLTFRAGEVGPGHPLWAVLGSLPHARSHHLRPEPLSREAVAVLAGDDAERVYAMTGGNPFYVSELLAADTSELPPSVANAVLGRASRLDDASRRLVELVSVVPAQVSTGVLDAVMPEWSSAAEEPERRRLLQVGVHHVSFRHELARAAIRSSVPAARRRRLHGEILHALLALEADPAEVVHHAEEAGELDVVASHALLAARRAAAVESNREAYAHYRRGADFAERQPEAEQAVLFEDLARAAYLVDRLPEAFGAIDRSIALREAHGDRQGLGRCLRLRARFHWYAGDGEAAWRQAHAAVATLEPLGESVELARAYSSVAQLAMLASNLEDAQAWGGRAVELATRLGDVDTGVHASVTLGLVRCLVDPDDTATLLDAFVEADRIGERHEAVRALLGLADRLFCWVRPDVAWDYNQRASAYAREHQVDTLLAFLQAMAAWHRLRLGDWDTAERLAVGELGGGESVTQLLARTVLAELAVRRGDTDAAERLAEVEEQAERTGELQWIGPVLELAMEWALLRGEPLPVQRIVRARDRVGRPAWGAEGYGARLTAWASVAGVHLPFEGQRPRPHAAMATADWAAAAAAFGEVGWDYDRALMLSLLDDEDALAEALGVCRRLDATLLEERIVRRMRTLGYRVPRGPQQATRGNRAGLTVRELEVLRLVADGLTNGEIAERLYVSPRTAEHHVSALLAKLAVPTRRAAARRAEELGLLGRV
jgi:DNA-binding CsgD family transcriptional regulator/tetratricopeptide (TPR) repeat protein